MDFGVLARRTPGVVAENLLRRLFGRNRTTPFCRPMLKNVGSAGRVDRAT